MSKRDNQWLLSRLNEIWERSFSDVAQLNPVFIVFGRKATYRFGSIRAGDAEQLHEFGNIRWRKQGGSQYSAVTINGLFKDPTIPQEVVDYTIAHELAHYAHGFSSPHKRKYRHPHKGGVVTRELKSRGLAGIMKAYRVWLKQYRECIRSGQRKRRLGLRIDPLLL